MVIVSSSSELATAIPKGGKIEIKPGNYYLNSIQFKTSNTTLVAADKNNKPVIFMANKHPSGPMLTGSGLTGITFENIILDGNFSNQPGAKRGSSSLVLVWLKNCSDVTSRGCTWRNAAIDGLKLKTCKGLLYENNIAHDLGHEAVYAMYGCSKGVVRNNKCKTRTNSFCRLSYGASDFKIYGNEVYSVINSTSTGPGMELDKGIFKDVEIYNNVIHDLNGSGIWISADQAECDNVRIHDNTFRNVGNFLNGTFKYNGYSNAGIAGAGMDGMAIENNIFEDIEIGYAILMAEAKHSVNGKYNWILKNNTLKNVKNGLRLTNSRAFISGDGNKFTDVKTLKMGVTNNINGKVIHSSKSTVPDNNKVTEDEDTAIPIDDTTDTADTETITAIVTVTDAEGKSGTQKLTIDSSLLAPRTVDTTLITVKPIVDGGSGAISFELPVTTPSTIIDNSTESILAGQIKLTVKIERLSGQVGQSTIMLATSPTTDGIDGKCTGVFKLRTPEGLYGQSRLDIMMAETTNLVKSMKSTVIAKTTKGELLHVTHDDNPESLQAVENETPVKVTVKLLTDTGMYGELTGDIELKKR